LELTRCKRVKNLIGKTSKELDLRKPKASQSFYGNKKPYCLR
jgi:hypothetical protein